MAQGVTRQCDACLLRQFDHTVSMLSLVVLPVGLVGYRFIFSQREPRFGAFRKGDKSLLPGLGIMEAETNTSSSSSRMASGEILTHSERRRPQKAARARTKEHPLFMFEGGLKKFLKFGGSNDSDCSRSCFGRECPLDQGYMQ